MKQYVVLFLANVLLLLSGRDVLTIAAFKWHQEEIAATLCINRNPQVPMCFGQCYLEEQLSFNKEHPTAPLGSQQPELSDRLVYCQLLAKTRPAQTSTLLIRYPFRYQDGLGTAFVRQCFQPPRRG